MGPLKAERECSDGCLEASAGDLLKAERPPVAPVLGDEPGAMITINKGLCDVTFEAN